jgi:hypothetical protein
MDWKINKFGAALPAIALTQAIHVSASKLRLPAKQQRNFALACYFFALSHCELVMWTLLAIPDTTHRLTLA